MKITILAFGSRGDVQPAVALGKELKARGHLVRMVAGSNFREWIEHHGLEAPATSIDTQTVMESELGHDWIERGTGALAQMRAMKRLIARFGTNMVQETWDACRDAEAIIGSFTSYVFALTIAEQIGARYISAALQPSMIATRSGAATINAPLSNRASAINHLFGKLVLETAGWKFYGEATNRFRAEALRLAPDTRRRNIEALRRSLVVHGYSQWVVPHPSDWPASFHTTGYWFLDESEGWEPPRELIAFLDSPSPTVSIGFGSMTGRDTQAITRLIIEAVRESGARAVLLSGWGRMGGEQLPSNILRIDSAPHEWLFPRVSAAIHHGGAGTTAASLRAGVPAVIVPHLGDQPFWGKRVEALGVGPRAIPRKRLTASSLAEAIRCAISATEMKRRAADLGEKIRAERGTARAADLIEEHLKVG